MNRPVEVNGWKNLKQRLSFKGFGGCCGATWSQPRTPITILTEQEEEEESEMEESEEPILGNQSEEGILIVAPNNNINNGGMNLRMALEAERNSRVGLDHVGPPTKSLMRLIEETDGVDLLRGNPLKNGSNEESDWVCCVCMERSKGTAFIPCGHAFCRICSRELWVKRGFCPVCNRSILDVLDIF